MFITRKQYEMDLRRAKAEGRREALKEVQTVNRMDKMEENFYNSLERVENSLLKIALKELKIE